MQLAPPAVKTRFDNFFSCSATGYICGWTSFDPRMMERGIKFPRVGYFKPFPNGIHALTSLLTLPKNPSVIELHPIYLHLVFGAMFT